ncbi:MAG: DUF5610 domain-containing protein [Mariprofundus sp.]|nr:DUF5610 domain-containing protein [Mariprofundus sp.]
MASGISNIDLSKLLPPTTTGSQKQNNNIALTSSRPISASSIDFSVKNNPTALILQSALEKINAQFAPYIGDGALQKAIDSGQDMSPKGVADSILSFATQLIGRAEAAQADLPINEQRSRERLFQHVQSGIETGFKQANSILESMQALSGKTKDSVNSTYDYVQQGLIDLAALLDLSPVTKA